MNRLKILPFILLLFTASISSQAQAVYKAHADGWLVDLNEAYKISKETGKPIMANFTGSDWCGWCHKLKRETFDTPEFKAWADTTVVLLEVDFPRKFKLPENIQQQNQGLQQYFQVRGYPTIWVFDLDVNEEKQFAVTGLGKTSYQRSVSAFTNSIDSAIKNRKK